MVTHFALLIYLNNYCITRVMRLTLVWVIRRLYNQQSHRARIKSLWVSVDTD